ncbi:phosphoribosylaminoimidazolesuccinocarboxamide synthase [Mycoplasma sp. P36-A1]|uniref:phosphoribosylaminoimidazolesuccinocarboxamide synthase n=1 Tax=Mycoplasma sp. P36-A1 TaxID=3252900 RepID=UPI003C2AB5CE
MENKEMIYEGKAKIVYQADNENEVIIYFKDDATAFNGVKKASIQNKGILNNKITTIIFNYLESNGVDTHYIKTLNDREQLTDKIKIIPLEFICRNIVAGSMAKRLGMEEGQILEEPILEICYKKDELNDPLLNDYHAYALGLVTKEQLHECYDKVLKVNELLQKLFLEIGIILVDFKVEFGFNKEGKIVLADEFSPDNARLWDEVTKKKLDKDVFRRDLGNIVDTYQYILEKLEDLNL